MDAIIIFRGGVLLIVATCVPLLLYIGYKLFVMGAQGNISISHSSGEMQSKLTNLSPGAFCFFLSIVLGYFLIGAKASVFIPEASQLDKASSPTAAPANDVVKTTLTPAKRGVQFEWFTGRSTSLSQILLEEYSKVGMCLHRRSFLNTNKDFLLKESECFKSINVMVKIPINEGGISDLTKYEKLASEGDPVGAQQLKAWRYDNIKEKQ